MNDWMKEEMSYIRLLGNPQNKETERELVILLPVGCYWAKKNKPCSYCGYQPVVNGFHDKYGEVDYVDILKNEVGKQELPFQRITFFVGGSFLEIPPQKQIEIFEYVDTLTITDVFIESRPELIREENIAALKNCLHNKDLMVAIGLESSKEEIRNEIHEKGILNKTYFKAMDVLKNLEVKSLVYVFVKPPVANITDKEAYEEAMDTIKFAFETGAYAVEIESGYIVENSRMYDLYIENQYQVLNLWTIFKLLQDAIKLDMGLCRLAYFSDTPEPIAIPKSCEKCTDKLYETLDKYRKTLDSKYIYEIKECDCKKDWNTMFNE